LLDLAFAIAPSAGGATRVIEQGTASNMRQYEEFMVEKQQRRQTLFRK
jgi:hypothetical protein